MRMLGFKYAKVYAQSGVTTETCSLARLSVLAVIVVGADAAANFGVRLVFRLL